MFVQKLLDTRTNGHNNTINLYFIKKCGKQIENPGIVYYEEKHRFN